MRTRASSFKVRAGPSGLSFFNRTTGLNILCDEIETPPSAWAPAPRQVSIALTNACDLACSYCFAPKTRASLSFNAVTSWLAELDANGTFGVGFGGGEPTLYPRFAELCEHACRNTGLAVTFTTHGHRLDDRLLNALAGNVHFIRVSMDGIEATYERLRHRSFRALAQRLTAIKAIARFGINYVVNSDTFPDLTSAIAFAENVGASEFLLLPEQPVNGEGGINNATAQGLRAWVERYSGSVPLTISENGADGLQTCDPFRNEGGLRAYAHVDAHGILKRTSYDDAGIAVGPDGIMRALKGLQHRANTGS